MKPAVIYLTRLLVVSVMILSLFFFPDSTSLAQGIGFPAEINKRFLPITILPGEISRLKVTVYNPNGFALTNVKWDDNLVGVQPGLFIADPPNITHDCGSSAVITANPGETILSLEQGEVPAQVGIVPGKCSVEVDVSSITTGNLINTIPAQELEATGGGFNITNTTPASATLQVPVVQSPSLDKTFNPATIWVGRPSQLTITIRNNDLGAALTQTELTDTLPVGVVLADPVLPSLTGCGSSAVLTANPGEGFVKIEEATINANTTCSIKVNVTSLVQGVYANTIPAQAIQTRQGVTNASGTTKNLNVQAVGITKAFNPTSIPAGGSAILTITLQNPSAIAYTNAQMVDVLPAAPSPLEYVPGSASTTCGAGTVSIDNPKKLSLTGGTIPASANPASAFGTCTVTVQVTAPISASAAATNTNTIPVTPIGGDITNGGLITDQGTNSTAATASLGVQAVSAIKSFDPTSIPAGGSSLLTITLRNPTGTAYTAVKLTDTLPGTVLEYVGGTEATTCGGSLTITPPRTIVLEGGTIPASPTPPTPFGTCTITVRVAAPEGASAASFTNTIPAGGLETGQGAKNVGSTTAPLSVYVPGLPPTVAKTFTNSTITIPGGNSRLRIVITAPPDADLAGFQLTDNLPEGMFISNSTAASKSAGCGPSSVLTAVTDTRVVSLTNATINQATTCQIDVYVSASSSGVYANTITPQDVVYTGAPPIPQNVTQNLTVNELSPLTIRKVFYPGSVAPEGLSTLTIELENNNLSPLTNVQLLDTLPGTVSAGVVVAPDPEASTDCGGGVVTAVPGTLTISMAGGTIPAKVGTVPGLCTIVVNVQGKGANATRTNTIPIVNVTATIGESGPTINPLAQATAPLTITGLTIGVVKSFEPQDVTGGASSTLKVELINPNAVILTGISFTDNLPTGMIIANPASLDVGTCGGTLTGASGDELFIFSGGVLQPLTSCALTLKATMTITGNTTNRLEGATPGPSSVTTFNGAKNPDPAQASLTNLPGASVNKFFSPNPIAAGAGNYSLLTITIKNTSSIGLTGMRLMDELVEEISIIGSPAPGPVNNCNGTLTAEAGTQLVELVGGSLNASSQCTIVVPVGGVTPGEYNNLIPPGALITIEQITNSEPAEDDLVLTGTPGMSISKQANVESVRFAGDQIIYTYNLENTGNLPLANITLVDDNFTSGNPGDDFNPVYQSGDTNDNDILDVDETWIYTFTVTVTQAQINAGLDLVNVATADSDLTEPVTATDTVVINQLASIGNFVWDDLNRNGIQDTGELGVAGVTVNLKDGTGATVGTDITDANGLYLFENLVPGDYHVEVVKPAGYGISPKDQGSDDAVDSDADPATGVMATTTLEPGENDLTWDAGIYRLASIGDFVWDDLNRNGIQDTGELGVAGVTVKLYDGQGVLVGTDITDANGLYLFENLVPGDYHVEVVKPAGYAISPKDQGSDNAVDSDADPATGVMATTTLEPGENDLTWDAGIYRLASIGDFIWDDLNRNGVQDTGELGVAGVTVKLYDGQGVLVGTDITDANGLYLFENLVPGDYHVEVVKPAGYAISPKDQGSDNAVDSDADPVTGLMATTTLEPGENDLTWDAGVYRLASIGNFVWEDLNRNGVQETGEPGVAGVTVNLEDGTGAVVDTMTTDSNGFYLFDELVPGDYSVEVVKPTGYEFTLQDQGTDDAVDSDVNGSGAMIVTTLAPGENDLTWDAGIYRPASLGDYIWEDLNLNGVQDTGEPGVAGVTVNLRDGTGVIVGTTTTDSNGFYLFDNLVPGDYSVEVVKPVGYAISPKDQGSDDAVDSDADPATGVMATTTLVSGENDLTWDAGLMRPDLVITKGNSTNGPVYLGQSFTWTIEVRNNGSSATFAAGYNFIMRDVLPSGATYSNVNGPNPAIPGLICEIAGTTTTILRCRAGTGGVTLEAGASFTVSVDVTPTQVGTLDNTAVVDFQNSVVESNEENNNDSDSVEVLLPASLGDYVWEDLNLNGIQETGEPGVAGVTVNLKDGTGAIVDTTTTDSNGYYLFDELVPGDYSVEVIKPAGYEFTLQDQGGYDTLDSDVDSSGAMIVTTLVSGENDLTWDAGIYRPASLGNFVWEDLNRNGIQDTGEPGVAGVTVNLYSGTGTIVGTVLTDINGYYLFDNLVPGDYSVEVIKPAGYGFSPQDQGGDDAVDSDAGIDGKMAVTTLEPGENDLTWDAGLVRPDLVINKENNTDGSLSLGETFTWTIVVTNSSSAATFAEGYNFILRDVLPAGATYANVSGTYSSIPGLICEIAGTTTEILRCRAGTGGVSLEADASFTVSVDVTPTQAGTLDNTAVVDFQNSVIESNEENNSDSDSVEVLLLASIGNFVWEDLNRNGIQETGEPGVAGVTVNLKDGTGAIVDTMTTDGNGYYLFENLLPGDYSVEVVKPAGYEFTLQDQGGDNAVDSDVDSSGAMVVTTLEAGENDLTWDAGIYRPASIGNFVWKDLNRNGIQDTGEPGVAGVTVNLKDGTGAIVDTMTTDGNGYYMFENLVPGDYSVEVIKPAGYEFTLQDQLSADGDYVDSDADPATGAMIVTTLEAGENDLTWDAGIYQLASIGNFVWEDLNRNGVQDTGEPGVAGVTVNLKDGTGAVVDTMTTDSNGYYMFENLVPGDYSVEVVKPAGYEFTQPHQGGDDYVDSDADPATGAMDLTNLESGENDLKWDAGLVKLALDLTVEKSNDASMPLYVGDTFTWTIRVTNSGNSATFAEGLAIMRDVLPSGATYGNVAGDFSNIPGLVCEIVNAGSDVLRCWSGAGVVELADGTSFTVSVDVTPTQPGALENTAIVDPDGNLTESNEDNNLETDSVTVLVVLIPDLTLEKSANPTTYAGLGEPILYTYTLTNSGTVPLNAPYSVSDDKATVTCPPDPASLLPGGEVICSATYNITQADLDAGTVVNIATATAKDQLGNDVTSNQDSEEITGVSQPALKLVKQADETFYNQVGDVLHYSYFLVNDGNVTLNGPFTIDDDRAEDESCPATDSLTPGSFIICTATYTINAGDLDAGSVTNTATGLGYHGTTPVTTAQETETVNTGGTVSPSLLMVKNVNETSYDEVGDILNYSYYVINNGNITLTGPFQVEDDKATDESCPPTDTLAPGAYVTCIASYTVTQGDLDAGSVTNLAFASGSYEGSPVVTSTDTVTVNTDAQANPALVIVKTVLESSYDEEGDVLNYSYLVINTGNVTLTGPFTVDDDRASDESCPATDSLAPGQNITCTATYTVTQGDLEAGSVTNNAFARGYYGGNPVDSNQDSKTVDRAIVPNPSIRVVKSALQTYFDEVDDVLDYSYLVINTGYVPLEGPFTISDDRISGITCPDAASLDPGGYLTCTASYTVTQGDLENGSVTNIATAQGYDEGSPVNSGPDDASVPARGPTGPSLMIIKSAAENVYREAGDVIHYSYLLINNGNVRLEGPFSVEDDKASDESCPGDSTLDPGMALTCTATYTITAGDVEAGSVTNVASARSYYQGSPVDSGQDTENVVKCNCDFPALVIVKTASEETFAVAGDVLNYTYLVINAGNVVLDGPFTVEDDKASDESCPGNSNLGPGDSLQCSASYTVTEDDVANGSVTNLASAQGSFQGNPVNSDQDSETVGVIADQRPSIKVVKSAFESYYDSVGDVLNYSYLVVNDGNVPLSGPFSIDDNLTGDENCPSVDTINPGNSITCTATYTVSEDDLLAGSVTNTVTATGYFNGSPLNSSPDDETVIAGINPNPGLMIVKSADKYLYSEDGEVINYAYLLINTGNVPLEGPFTVDDNRADDESCPSTDTLMPGDFITCSASYTITAGDLAYGTVTNTAAAQGRYNDNPVNSNQDSETVTSANVPAPALLVIKSAREASYNAVGDVLHFTYYVINSGNVDLDGPFNLSDDKASDESCPDEGSLSPGEFITCTATYTVTAGDLTAERVTNLATAAASYDGNPVFSDEASVTVPIGAPAVPALRIVKNVAERSFTAAGDVLNYSYFVINTGTVTLYGPFSVSDDKASDESCPDIGSLDPGGFIICTASYTVNPEDVAAGSVTNEALARAYFADSPVTSPMDTETVNVDFYADPELMVFKSVQEDSYLEVDDVLHYSYLVINTGNVIVYGPFSIDDDRASDESCPATEWINPGESLTCTATYTVTQDDLDAGSVTNIARAQGSYATQPVISDPDSETVDKGTAANPSLLIIKNAVENRFSSLGDVLHYTYLVINTGNVTLSGPFTVNDDKSTDESCPATTSLDPGQYITCTATYTVTQDDLDADSVTNTATVQGYLGPTLVVSDPDTETVTEITETTNLLVIKSVTSSGPYSLGGTITFTISAYNTGNTSLTGVTITDPGAGVTMGSCSMAIPATLLPGQNVTCTASHVVTQDDITAGSYSNTALADSDQTAPGSDTQVVNIGQTASPAINVLKEVSVDGGTTWQDANSAPGPSLASGTDPQFRFTVTNSGNVTLTGITLGDTDMSSFYQSNLTTACSIPASLAASASFTCYGTLPWASGQHANTATATGTYNATQYSDTDMAHYLGTSAGPSISVLKEVSVDSGTTWEDANSVPGPSLASGTDPRFRFTVTNSGTVTLTGIILSDTDISNFYQSNLTTACSIPATLDPSASFSCYGKLTWAAGQHSNTATATGTYNATQYSDTDMAHYIGTAASPAITVLKEVSVDGGTTWQDANTAPGPNLASGTDPRFRFTVTNTGNVTLTGITLGDTDMSSFYQSNLTTACSIPASLAASASFTCYGKLTWALGQHTNTATATGTYNATQYSDTDLAHYNGVATALKTPTGTKTVTANPPELEWRMVWISSANNTAILTEISDTIASGSTYKTGSLTCEPKGSSVTTSCAYDSAARKVVWKGTIGPDLGKTTESAAANEVVITFKVTVDEKTNQVINKGTSVTDTDNDGSLTDENTAASKSETNEAKWDRVIIVVNPNITKSVSPSSAKTGETVTYTMKVTNTGNAPTTNVVVTDTVSSYLDITQVTASKGTAISNGRTATFNVGTVNVGDNITLTIKAKVNSSATVSVDVSNVAKLSHTSLGISDFENSNTVYLRIQGDKTLPNTGAGEPPVSLITWLSYFILGLLGMGFLAYGLYRWIIRNTTGRTLYDPKNIMSRWFTGLIPIILGVFFWLGLLLLYNLTWPTSTGQVATRGDTLQQPASSPEGGAQLRPDASTEVVTTAGPGQSQAGQALEGQSLLLSSGERVIVPVNTPEPELPMPAYVLPDPPADAPGISEYTAVSGEPDSSPVRSILIPAIGVNTYIDFIPFDGETWPLAGLGKQVAWLGDTSWPGLGSNTVLAGHVTMSDGNIGPFYSLGKLKAGDKIYISTERYIYVYTYMDTMEVEPTDTSVVNPTGSPQITLITCTDWDAAARSYAKRLVVIASLESVNRL